MSIINDVPINDLIIKVAQRLKDRQEIIPPDWARFVKTGLHKERPPVDRDWWYMRAASILKAVYTLGPIGVSKLRTKYGGRKNRGVRPEHFYRGSGSIIRKILIQLETAGLLKQVDKQDHKGRILTPEGVSFITKVASSMTGDVKKGKTVPKKSDKTVEKQSEEQPDEQPDKKTPKKSKNVASEDEKSEDEPEDAAKKDGSNKVDTEKSEDSDVKGNSDVEVPKTKDSDIENKQESEVKKEQPGEDKSENEEQPVDKQSLDKESDKQAEDKKPEDQSDDKKPAESDGDSKKDS
ncbi:30S ribosomal protein S19e [Candidatus Woesearchaeota archaeon]|nr:30S ribosomal protein S19e [Candidatus Woesearchaeota archaeon]